MKRNLIQQMFCLVFLAIVPGIGNSQVHATEPGSGEVVFERTESWRIHSAINGQEYELWVSLPAGYHRKDTVYPVIYLTDSYRAFSIMKGCVELFTIPALLIPEVILVGVGYGGHEEKALLRWSTGRTRDLTPVKNAATEAGMKNNIARAGITGVEVTTGGAPVFLDVLKKELIPFIESNYRIDRKSRMLAGYSFGGLFGLYVLFHDPGLFDKYFIGSPSISYGDAVVFRDEAAFAETGSDLDAEVFMSSGELEKNTTENINKLTAILQSRNYPGLYIKTTVFPGENHVTCYPPAISRALLELFGNK